MRSFTCECPELITLAPGGSVKFDAIDPASNPLMIYLIRVVFHHIYNSMKVNGLAVSFIAAVAVVSIIGNVILVVVYLEASSIVERAVTTPGCQEHFFEQE